MVYDMAKCFWRLKPTHAGVGGPAHFSRPILPQRNQRIQLLVWFLTDVNPIADVHESNLAGSNDRNDLSHLETRVGPVPKYHALIDIIAPGGILLSSDASESFDNS